MKFIKNLSVTIMLLFLANLSANAQTFVDEALAEIPGGCTGGSYSSLVSRYITSAGEPYQERVDEVIAYAKEDFKKFFAETDQISEEHKRTYDDIKATGEVYAHGTRLTRIVLSLSRQNPNLNPETAINTNATSYGVKLTYDFNMDQYGRSNALLYQMKVRFWGEQERNKHLLLCKQADI